MSETPDKPTVDTNESPLATLGWVGVVLLLAAVVIVLLSAVGPLGEV